MLKKPFIVSAIAATLLLPFTGCNQGVTISGEFPLNESEIYLLIGEEFQLSADEPYLQWKVLDEEIAGVDSSGTVTGIAVGDTEVTAISGNKAGYCIVRVVEEKISAIENITGNEEYINFYGRNYPSQNGYILINPVSAFEVKFYGANLTMHYVSGADASYRVGININTDNKTPPSEVTYLNNTTTDTEIVLAENLTSGWHTVKVTKTTESRTDTLAVKKITTDGYFGEPPQKPERKIEVYGDSITAGMNNLKQTGQDDVDASGTNSFLSYASVAARQLGSRLNMLACSGIGLYNTYGNTSFVAHKYYNKCSFAEKDFVNNTSLGNKTWIFSNYIPDVVIINLGTNDVWSKSNWTLSDEAELLDYYRQFIDNLNAKYNSQAKIVLAYGMMDSRISYPLSTLPDEYDNVYDIELPPRAKGHPSVEEHAEAGAQLAEFIKDLMYW